MSPKGRIKSPLSLEDLLKIVRFYVTTLSRSSWTGDYMEIAEMNKPLIRDIMFKCVIDGAIAIPSQSLFQNAFKVCFKDSTEELQNFTSNTLYECLQKVKGMLKSSTTGKKLPNHLQELLREVRIRQGRSSSASSADSLRTVSSSSDFESSAKSLVLPTSSPPSSSSKASPSTPEKANKANITAMLEKYMKTPEEIREKAIANLNLTASPEIIMSSQDSPEIDRSKSVKDDEIDRSSPVKDDHKLVKHWWDHGSLRIVGLVKSSQGTKEVFADMSAGADGFLIAKFPDLPDLPAFATEMPNLMAPAAASPPAKKKRKTLKDQCNDAQVPEHTPEKNDEHAVPKLTPAKEVAKKPAAKEVAKKPAAKKADEAIAEEQESAKKPDDPESDDEDFFCEDGKWKVKFTFATAQSYVVAQVTDKGKVKPKLLLSLTKKFNHINGMTAIGRKLGLQNELKGWLEIKTTHKEFSKLKESIRKIKTQLIFDAVIVKA